MTDFIANFSWECWRLLADAAPFMLVGLITGGLLQVFTGPSAAARGLLRCSRGACLVQGSRRGQRPHYSLDDHQGRHRLAAGLKHPPE